MRIAQDPTPFQHNARLLEFPQLVAELGYDYIQLTPHVDLIPFYRHPRANDAQVRELKRACRSAGVQIASLLPVQRWSGPDEGARDAAVRNWKRIIQIAVDLEVQVIGTEFSGHPDLPEESEAAFYRSMEELLPIIERENLQVLLDPHPGDFVEDGLEAIRIIGSLNSPNIGMAYVASHTFHMGHPLRELLRAGGDYIRLVHIADTMDHRASHGLRYVTNPPGSATRVHQHLRIGAGDVDWDDFFAGMAEIGFLNRADSIMCNSVFAEDEMAGEMSRYQLETMQHYLAKYTPRSTP